METLLGPKKISALKLLPLYFTYKVFLIFFTSYITQKIDIFHSKAKWALPRLKNVEMSITTTTTTTTSSTSADDRREWNEPKRSQTTNTFLTGRNHHRSKILLYSWAGLTLPVMRVLKKCWAWIGQNKRFWPIHTIMNGCEMRFWVVHFGWMVCYKPHLKGLMPSRIMLKWNSSFFFLQKKRFSHKSLLFSILFHETVC